MILRHVVDQILIRNWRRFKQKMLIDDNQVYQAYIMLSIIFIYLLLL